MFTGLLSNQGEKSTNFYFIMVPLRKKVLKFGTPKPSLDGFQRLQTLCLVCPGPRPFAIFWIRACITGLLSNQGEKSINFYFIRVSLRKKY